MKKYFVMMMMVLGLATAAHAKGGAGGGGHASASHASVSHSSVSHTSTGISTVHSSASTVSEAHVSAPAAKATSTTAISAAKVTPEFGVKSNGSSFKAPVPARTAAAKPVTAKSIDINTATEAELKAVPGIGDAYAKKIVAGRPYKNVTQLKGKVLPQAVYGNVNKSLIAKRTAAKPVFHNHSGLKKAKKLKK